MSTLAATGNWTRMRRKVIKSPAAALGLLLVLLFVGVALAGPFLWEADPYKMAVMQRLKPPSVAHPLGTDEFGRDLMARLIAGSWITMKVGVISVGIAASIGIALGLIAGYIGGKTDALISGVMDIMLAFPGFLLALAIVTTLGPSLENAIIAMGIRRIPVFARVIRGEVLSLRSREFVEASVAMGASSWHIMWHAILRNLWGPVIILATMQFPEAVLTAAGLSFLGLGAQPPSPEWGDPGPARAPGR